MLVMSVKTMLGLERLLPHQRMLQMRLLVPFDNLRMAGRVIFVSHQWTGYTDADATGEQLRALQGVVTRLMEGRVAKVESTWTQQILTGSNDIATAKQWKAALPHMYIWMDYASIPQPTAGAFSEDLIPQEVDRTGSFFGTFRKSLLSVRKVEEVAENGAVVGDCDDDHEQKANHRTEASPEEKGETVSTATTSSNFRDEEGNCTTCGQAEAITTSDHRQTTSATPEWKKHVQVWLGKAVESIPDYVERSTLVLVLVPPVEHVDRPGGELCDYGSWRGRGWCRLEMSGSALSRTRVRTMIVKSAVGQPEFIFPLVALFLAPGKGTYVRVCLLWVVCAQQRKCESVITRVY